MDISGRERERTRPVYTEIRSEKRHPEDQESLRDDLSWVLVR